MSKPAWAILFATVVVCCTVVVDAAEVIDVMVAGETPVEGVADANTRYGQFREPGMITTRSGRVVLLAQARDHSGWSDRSGQDLVVRHSDDHGKTWSKTIVAASVGNFSICPNAIVYDEDTDAIHCLYNLFLWDFNLGNKGRSELVKSGGLEKECKQFHIVSKDGGETWSEPREITQMLGNQVGAIGVFGSGRGIQLKHGKHAGRLCIPGGKRWDGWSNLIYYSDDHGQTWHTGNAAPMSTEAKKMNVRNECKVAELSDGTLVLNLRSMPFRTRAFSKDGGDSWSAIEPDRALPMASCNAALIKHTDRKTGKEALVFAAPAGPGRLNGVVCVSEDGGQTWPHRRVLLPETTFAYSTLCSLGDGTIGLAFETEVYHGGSYKHIQFIKFGLRDILGHKDELAGGQDPNIGTYENK
jgi:sialidase-1